MGKIYNIILNSNFGVGAGGANKTYCVNWCNLPDNKKFKLTWSFTCSTATYSNFGIINYVFCDLGQSNQFFATTTNNLTNKRYDFLGSLKPNVITNKYSVYTCNTESNPPIFLDRKPNNNIINVLVTGGSLITGGVNTFNYTLILSFEELE
jgi:hypothetical protein